MAPAPPKVRVSLQEAALRHAAAQPGASGLLVGTSGALSSGSTAAVVDLLRWDSSQQTSAAALQGVQHALPWGLSYVGLYAPDKDAAATLHAHPGVQQLLQAAPPSQPLLVLTLSGASGDDGSAAPTCALHTWAPASGAWQEVAAEPLDLRRSEPFGWAETLPQGPLVLCSVRATLPLDVLVTSGPSAKQAAGGGAALQQAVQQAADAWARALQPPAAQGAAFLAHLSGGQQTLLTSATPGTLGGLLPALPPASAPLQLALVAQPLRAGPPPGAAEAPAAPSFEYRHVTHGTEVTRLRTTLRLQALAYAPAAAPAAELAGSCLVPALLAQLHGAAAVLANRAVAAAASGDGGAAPKRLDGMTAHAFLPPGRSHHVTLLYPEGLPEAAEALELKLTPLRAELHRLLGLPPNRPCLRAAQALPLARPPAAAGDAPAAGGAGTGAQRLRDVHQGLQQPLAGAAVAVLEGSYEYYHYMQDRFNDAGWGCAYRSLQTIVSWFRLQQYTSKPVPTHREIQQMLVRLGDKQPDFVGSSQWIGAIELGYILDEYLGITCKVITVSRGSDIPSYARQLAQHFATQGTPVMIGGGVLAYTLLGVAFDELTGDCAFLILDPHYTGGEDLKKIHSGTWVWWKRQGDNAAAGGPLFVADAFYNFLCPQRPQQV